MAYQNHVILKLISKFDDPESSDLVIRVQNKPIHVHRQFVGLMSPYFATLLSTRWTKQDQNEVEIADFDYSTFYAYLRFLYTSEIMITKHNIDPIYHLAHCYMEKELMQRCDDYLRTNLTLENASKFYALALRLGIEGTRANLETLICNNLTINTQTYSRLLELAEEHQISPLRLRVEDYVLHKLRDRYGNSITLPIYAGTVCNLRFTHFWHTALKYKLVRVEDRLGMVLIRHFQNDYDRPRIIIAHLPLYYESAVANQNDRMQSLIEDLMCKNFNRSPVEWYQTMVEVNCGRIRAIIEDQLLPRISNTTYSQAFTTEDLCMQAIKHNRLACNQQLKRVFEQQLMRHDFSLRELYVDGHFKSMLKIAIENEMNDLKAILLEQCREYLFDGLFSDLPEPEARELVAKAILGSDCKEEEEEKEEESNSESGEEPDSTSCRVKRIKTECESAESNDR